MTITRKREYSFDNCKLILIILVVFAHFLEFSKGYGAKDDWYRIIYSFHMPAMVFIAGYFAKFNKKNIFTLSFLYLIFQNGYISFANKKLNQNLNFQITTPYWLLWFLLAYIFYLMLIPLLDFKKYNKKNIFYSLIIIAVTFFIHFYFPKDKTQGYYLSVSRFITFLPFFVSGFYFNKLMKNEKAQKYLYKGISGIVIRIIFLLLVFLAIHIIKYNKNISPNMLYGSYSYKSAKYSDNIKAKITFCSIVWIGFIIFTLRFNKKIFILTRMGSTSLTIFLFHGFILRYIQYKEYFKFHEVDRKLIFLFSICIVAMLGNIIMEYFSKYILHLKILDVFKKIYLKFYDRIININLDFNDDFIDIN